MLVLDGEFSGVDQHKNSIVSLGALDFDNPTNRFYAECRIWDGAHVNDDALKVNGFTEAEVMDPEKMTEAELVRNFIAWSEEVRDRTFVGQNVSLDRDMLRAATGRAGYQWPFAYRTIDTHSLCYMHIIKRGLTPPFDEEHRRSALNLDAVLTYCGIPEEPQPHNALTGALVHAEVTSRLLYNKTLLPEFEQYEIPWQ